MIVSTCSFTIYQKGLCNSRIGCVKHHSKSTFQKANPLAVAVSNRGGRGKSFGALTCLTATRIWHLQITWDPVTLSASQLLSRGTRGAPETPCTPNRINADQQDSKCTFFLRVIGQDLTTKTVPVTLFTSRWTHTSAKSDRKATLLLWSTDKSESYNDSLLK